MKFYELKKRNAESVEKISQFISNGFWDELGELPDPRFDDQPPVETLRIHVEDAASADGGRRGWLDVAGLEDQVGLGWQANDLSAHQAQLLILVKHSVHVFDPLRVHGAVEDEPFALRGRHGRKLAEVAGQDAVAPLVIFEVSVQLVDFDGRGVEDDDGWGQTIAASHCFQRGGQHLPGLGLAAERLSEDQIFDGRIIIA